MSPRPLNLLSLRARLMVLVLAGIVSLLAFDLGRQYLDYRAASESMGEHARVTTQIDRDARVAEINRIQIQQVLINLMRNALEAMSKMEHRELAIRISAADEGMIEFELADNGPGLPPEAAAQLFKPFVSTTSRGMGLGLSICRSIIGAHGGWIWAVKNTAGGASFHFTVPRGAVDSGAV